MLIAFTRSFLLVADIKCGFAIEHMIFAAEIAVQPLASFF
jgi:hypothetical protein